MKKLLRDISKGFAEHIGATLALGLIAVLAIFWKTLSRWVAGTSFSDAQISSIRWFLFSTSVCAFLSIGWVLYFRLLFDPKRIAHEKERLWGSSEKAEISQAAWDLLCAFYRTNDDISVSRIMASSGLGINDVHFIIDELEGRRLVIQTRTGGSMPGAEEYGIKVVAQFEPADRRIQVVAVRRFKRFHSHFGSSAAMHFPEPKLHRKARSFDAAFFAETGVSGSGSPTAV